MPAVEPFPNAVRGPARPLRGNVDTLEKNSADQRDSLSANVWHMRRAHCTAWLIVNRIGVGLLSGKHLGARRIGNRPSPMMLQAEPGDRRTRFRRAANAKPRELRNFYSKLPNTLCKRAWSSTSLDLHQIIKLSLAGILAKTLAVAAGGLLRQTSMICHESVMNRFFAELQRNVEKTFHATPLLIASPSFGRTDTAARSITRRQAWHNPFALVRYSRWVQESLYSCNPNY